MSAMESNRVNLPLKSNLQNRNELLREKHKDLHIQDLEQNLANDKQSNLRRIQLHNTQDSVGAEFDIIELTGNECGTRNIIVDEAPLSQPVVQVV